MTTNSSKFDQLANQLGRDNADAIAAFVDDRFDARTEELRAQGEELKQLTAEVRELIAQHGASNPEVRQAAQAVQQAREEHNAEVRQHNAEAAQAQAQPVSSPVEPAAPQDDSPPPADRTSQVRQVVDKSRSALEAQVADHENRIKKLEDARTGDLSRIDQAKKRADEAHSVSARAVAIARSAGGDGGRLEHATRIALAVFGIVFVLYLLVWGLTPLEHTWRDQFAWPFGFGALAFWLSYLFGGDGDEGRDDHHAEAQAEARVDDQHHRQVAKS